MSAWTIASAWLVGAWNDVVKFAVSIWTKISSTINTYFWMAVAYVQAVWNKISSFFVNAWNTYIAGPLHTLWTNVSNVFSSAWNTYIAGPLGGIWNSVSTWFTNLGTGAMNSGKNFITMLVNGIKSGAGAIWNAVVGIATSIWKALGFHSPAEEGPGADADKWMPNLVSMLSSGLTTGIPKIQAAVNLVAKPLATLGSPSTAAAGTAAAPATTTNNGGDIAIHVHLGDSGTGADAQKRGKDIADVVKKELARTLRQQSIAPRYTSGGTHQ
jgi:phage-related protein